MPEHIRTRFIGSVEDRLRYYSRIDEATGCWIWIAGRDRDGYGHLTVNGKCRVAPRLSYETFVGEIPEGLEVDHLCKLTSCINPKHLEPVTPIENVRRSNAGKRLRDMTHCINGHEFTPENTWVSRKEDGKKRNMRYCKECGRLRKRQYRKDGRLTAKAASRSADRAEA